MKDFSFIPKYPIEDYINWAMEQDENFLDINANMWSKLNHDILLYVYELKKQHVEDVEDFETFCKMSYIIQAYHKVLDIMVKEEIEEMIADINKNA